MLETFDKSACIAQINIRKFKASERLAVGDEVAVEEPLEIHLKYRAGQDQLSQVVALTMRTPGNDEDLALGFLFTEGILQHLFQVRQVCPYPNENRVVVELEDGFTPSLAKMDRNFYTTSSCGVCGKTSIDAIKSVSLYKDQSAGSVTVRREIVYTLADAMVPYQELFKRTGGLHASALFTLDGMFEGLREDVGRHNALDKLIGNAFRKDALPLTQRLLYLSGRASFELIQKASMAGIQLVVAVGAPSSLAVQLAVEYGITLVGFLRPDSFNVYSGDQRVL